MQKHCSIQFFWIRKLLCVTLNRIPLPMRLLIIMLCISMGCINAANSYAQNTILELNVNNQTVESVLNEIEAQTEFMFFYNSKQVDVHRRVSITSSKKNVFKVLDEIFKNTDVAYSVLDKSIILSNKQLLKAESQRKITGKIVDVNGEPIIGATVSVRGSNTGTVSDIDGNFVLYVEAGTEILLDVSYIGYKKEEIKTDGNKPVKITLLENMAMLDEVVVVGYGVQKKVNLTGAVANVNFDNDMTSSRPITNVSSALSGTMPGLNVRQGSGVPGADGATLRLRGVGSLNAGQDPLVLIDGQPGDIGQISANDIASVTVLKDAASAAIYGSRASNGVILITTKTGSNTNGKIELEYTGSVGWNKATKLPELVSNTADYMDLCNQVARNSQRTELYKPDFIDMWREQSQIDPIKYPNTDWWDALLNNNMVQTHQISLRGGNNRISSYTSVNFQNNDGLMNNTSYKVVNLRSNTDFTVNDWIKIGVNVSGMLGVNDAGDIGGALSWFYSTSPGMVPRNPDGRYGTAQTGTGDKNNPLWILEAKQGEKNKRRFTGKVFAVLTPLEGLVINASYFRDIYNYKENIVDTDLPRWDFRLEQQVTTGKQGIITNQDSNSDRYVIDLFATYNKTIARKHNIGVLAGYNQEYCKAWWFNVRKAGLISLSTPVLSAASDLQNSGGGKDDYAMMSYFGRINYDYAGKYLLEANVRLDGSSRFAPGNRWGTFPSFSAAWRISEEAFWENLKPVVDNFKIRTSWGRLGNNGIGNYDWQNVYSPANTSFGDAIQQGVWTTAIANRNISWEKTDVVDLGLDVNLFGNLSLTFDYYNKLTHGILYRNPIPYVNGGLAAPMVNSAKVRNRGFEFSASYNKMLGDLGLSVSVNGAYNRNKIIDYKGDYLETNGATVWTENQPIGKFYIREVDHIVQDKAEIDKLVSEGWTFSPSRPEPGDFLYKDLNNDKRIDDKDRVLKGQPLPLFTFGGSIALSYKNFDFNALFTGVAGWDRYLSTGIFSLTNAETERLFLKQFQNQWSETNRNTSIPKLYASNEKNNQVSDYYLYDASFLRVKTIQLGYTIPKNLIPKVRIRAYCNLENFFTITSYPGMDPEMDGDVGYPILKTVSLGVNIKF